MDGPRPVGELMSQSEIVLVREAYRTRVQPSDFVAAITLKQE